MTKIFIIKSKEYFEAFLKEATKKNITWEKAELACTSYNLTHKIYVIQVLKNRMYFIEWADELWVDEYIQMFSSPKHLVIKIYYEGNSTILL